MTQFTVEDMVQHVTKTFNTKKEAYQYKLATESRFPTVQFTLYPAEPIQPFPGMCERCGEHPAAPRTPANTRSTSFCSLIKSTIETRSAEARPR